MRNVFWKVTGFVLLIVGLFVALGQKVPQIASYPPKEFSEEEFQKMAQAQLLEKGRQVFGTGGERCSQCHIIGQGTPGRGPNLAGVGARAVERARKRAQQTGRPYAAEDYIFESMIEPQAYIVKGYPPIMPKVYLPPLHLSETDMKAVAAFLLSQSGQGTITPTTKLQSRWAQRIQAA